MLEYELMDAKEGIQKVRVEPATRSAVPLDNYMYVIKNWKKVTKTRLKKTIKM